MILMDPKTKVNESVKRKFVLEPQNQPMEIDKNTVLTTHPVEYMTVLDIIASQFLSSKGEKFFYKVRSPVNGIIECVVKKHLYLQARKITNQTFLNSLATLVPKDRHHLIFKDHESIGSTCAIPSKLMFNRISDMMKHKPTQVECSVQTPPRQRQKRTPKLVVYQGINQAVSSIPETPSTITTTTSETSKTSETSTTVQPKPATPNEPNAEIMDKISTLFSSFSSKIDIRLSELEQKQISDHQNILSVTKELSSVKNTIDTTNFNIKNLESQIVSTIQTSVQSTLQTYSSKMEQQLSTQLTATSAFLDKRAQDREAKFRDEFKSFMDEFTLANEAKSGHVNDLNNIMEHNADPSFIEHEVTFTSAQHSHATLDEVNDLSFESHHE
jgi:hypothetical protein